MDHDSDDARPELDTDATPLPDLASAFLAALDGDGALPPPPPEVRLAAALDLVAAIDASIAESSASAAAAAAAAGVSEPGAAPALQMPSEGASSSEDPFEPFALLPPTADSAALTPGDTDTDMDLATEPLGGGVDDFAAAAPVAQTEDLFAGLEEPTFDESAVDGPPVDGPAVDGFATAAVLVAELAITEPLIEEPSVAEPTAEESVVEESLADDTSSDAPLDLEEFIVFSLADTRCVVPIRNVVEVGRIPDAAPVPNAPAWLHGLGNLRGQVLTLIDLRAFLGLGRIRPSAGRMIVLRADADEVVAGLMVDHVHQIVSLSPSRFQTAPATLPPGFGGFVWGVCDYGTHTMIGLDVDSVLGAEVEQAETTVLTV